MKHKSSSRHILWPFRRGLSNASILPSDQSGPSDASPSGGSRGSRGRGVDVELQKASESRRKSNDNISTSARAETQPVSPLRGCGSCWCKSRSPTRNRGDDSRCQSPAAARRFASASFDWRVPKRRSPSPGAQLPSGPVGGAPSGSCVFCCSNAVLQNASCSARNFARSAAWRLSGPTGHCCPGATAPTEPEPGAGSLFASGGMTMPGRGCSLTSLRLLARRSPPTPRASKTPPFNSMLSTPPHPPRPSPAAITKAMPTRWRCVCRLARMVMVRSPDRTIL